MTTTDEMKEKLERENEQLIEEIKKAKFEVIRPKERQITMNKKVLEVINKQSYKENYGKKKKQKNKVQDNNKEPEA